MEKYNKLKKFVIKSIMTMLVIDLIVGISSLTYSSNSTSLIFLGFASHALISEYSKYKTKANNFSKAMSFFCIILIGLSAYDITRNLVSILV